MKGVRIGLPAFPFKDVNYKCNGKYSFYPNVLTEDGKHLDFIFSYPKEKLYKIEYIKEPIKTELFSIITNENEHTYNYQPENIGKYKLSEWDFQNEWRYKVFLMPNELIDLSKNTIKIEDNAKLKIEEIFSQEKGLISYYDMELDPNMMNDLEIMTGPLCGEAEYEIINSLVERHASNARVIKSELRIRK